jgi:hypothetical protein
MVELVIAHDYLFVKKHDDFDQMSLPLIWKCITTIPMMTYGHVVNACDEFCESMAMILLKNFASAIHDLFKD